MGKNKVIPESKDENVVSDAKTKGKIKQTNKKQQTYTQ